MDSHLPMDAEEISDNFIKLIGADWMLVTAGGNTNYNTMTASWGTIGVLWNKPISIIFIRPQRYTYLFTEQFDFYTLSFFNEKDKNILQYCGAHSGKDVDKAKETGLVVKETPLGNTYFEQAKLVLECKKLYSDDLKAKNFLVQGLVSKHYPINDFHRFYIGEIINAYREKEHNIL